jgi:hypothetical protein
MSRLAKIQPAVRPRMHGRAMISGPSGSGKTWTALRVGLALTGGDISKVLLIDTERESALTYADVFGPFGHLPWAAPYDPSELTKELDGIDADQYQVVIVDSFSKFWQGQGGTLDIADGKFGGWKSARPVQEAVVEQLLAVPAHVILCVRSKMAYSAEQGANGKQTITRLGLSPIQDDNLVYEMNIAVDMDMEHRITVTKSRTNAVPVGRMYPAGLEQKLAEDYREWLDGGVPPASREDIERIVGRFAEVVDADQRTRLKTEFKEMFGMPHSITALQVADAEAWLNEHLNVEVLAQASIPVEEPALEVSGPSGSAYEPPEGGAVLDAPADPMTPVETNTAAPIEEKTNRIGRIGRYVASLPLEVVDALAAEYGLVLHDKREEKYRREWLGSALILNEFDPDVEDSGWQDRATP